MTTTMTDKLWWQIAQLIALGAGLLTLGRISADLASWLFFQDKLDACDRRQIELDRVKRLKE